MLTKIISGGQTGVDRAALDAALACGFPCGGWCPGDRGAEDGPISRVYPMSPIPGGGYADRTHRNLMEADGTVVIHFGPLRGGTALTVELCRQHVRRCWLIDGEQSSISDAIESLCRFVSESRIAVLNVAGPRASQCAHAYRYAYAVIAGLIERAAHDP